MPGADDYTWRGPRLFETESWTAASDASEGRPQLFVACALCYLDLPGRLRGGELELQVTFGLFCEAPAPDVCPFVDYLAPRTYQSGHAALSSDRIRSEVHPS